MDETLGIELGKNGGKLTLAQFMDVALYDSEHGYYTSAERKPGRGGDFLTSPEASPLFGITLARQIVEFWQRLGSPNQFDIREYGSGVGGLAYDILASIDSESPACFSATTYRLAERNRHRQAEALTAFRDIGLIDKVVDESDVNFEPIMGVVLANEVADAFPAHRLEYRGGCFREHWIQAADNGLTWTVDDVSEQGESAIRQLLDGGVVPVEGGIFDVSIAATAWFAGATQHLERGFSMIIDYGYEAPELYSKHRLFGTLRGYYGHTVSDDPFVNIGEQDLTIHVDFSALRLAGESGGMTFAGITTQGAALASLGLGDHLMAMQGDPETTMDEYLSTQAVVRRLIDPGGLGRFRIQVMAKKAEISPSLMLFAVPPPPF